MGLLKNLIHFSSTNTIKVKVNMKWKAPSALNSVICTECPIIDTFSLIGFGMEWLPTKRIKAGQSGSFMWVIRFVRAKHLPFSQSLRRANTFLLLGSQWEPLLSGIRHYAAALLVEFHLISRIIDSRHCQANIFTFRKDILSRPPSNYDWLKTMDELCCPRALLGII